MNKFKNKPHVTDWWDTCSNSLSSGARSSWRGLHDWWVQSIIMSCKIGAIFLGNDIVFIFFLIVTGKTLAENAKIFPPLSEGQVKLNFDISNLLFNTFHDNVYIFHWHAANYSASGQSYQINWPYTNTLWKSCTGRLCSKNHWQRGTVFLRWLIPSIINL